MSGINSTRPILANRRTTGLTLPVLVVLVSHFAIDAYAAIVPAILGLIEVHYHLTPTQAAQLLGLGSFCSGLAQPISALISDHLDSRLLGALGVATASVFVCLVGSIGYGFPALAVTYAVGMIGVGMFHPVGASVIGRLEANRHSLAISLFFVAGMIGGVVGSFSVPRLVAGGFGLERLSLFMMPGLFLALILYPLIAKVSHCSMAPAPTDSNVGIGAQNWLAVVLLFVCAVLRFMVNTGLIYLYLRWAQSLVLANHPEWTMQQIATNAAPGVGNLNAVTIAGMAIGGLLAGVLVVPGKEKWPLVMVPVLFAPAVALFPLASLTSGYLLALLAGIGFAAMIPTSIALAQRLLPHRTGLASSLIMGGSWSIAMLGPWVEQQIINSVGLNYAFCATAILLVISGLLAIPLRGELIQDIGSTSDRRY